MSDVTVTVALTVVGLASESKILSMVTPEWSSIRDLRVLVLIEVPKFCLLGGAEDGGVGEVPRLLPRLLPSPDLVVAPNVVLTVAQAIMLTAARVLIMPLAASIE